MLTASFEPRVSRDTAVCGAWQYDTGQRLRMHGLPPPWELCAGDDAGAVVQVHYSRRGDAQSEQTLATWNDEAQAWIAPIPDDILTRAEPVRADIYVYYGEEDGTQRAGTLYTAVFTPRERSAPSDVVTQEQLGEWAAKQEDIDILLAAAEAAQARAQTQADSARLAAGGAYAAALDARKAGRQAGESADALRAACAALGVPVTAEFVGADEEADAQLDDGALVLRIPAGLRGERGEKGQTGDKGPADVRFALTEGVLDID